MELLLVSLIIFLVAFIPRFLAARKIDMTWDEGLYAMNGMIALRNVVSLNFSTDAWGFEFHPPVMMYFYGIAYGLYTLIKNLLKHKFSLNRDFLYREAISGFSGRQPLTVIRMPSIILGSLSSVIVYLLCLDLFGSEIVGIIAALFLALTPLFIGWSTLAMLESGITFFYLLTIWSFLRAIGQGSLLYTVLSGIALGLTFGTRETGFLLPLVVLPWLGITSLNDYMIVGWEAVLWRGQLVLLWLFLGLIVFYATWPWLWRNPIKQFMRNLRATSKMSSGGSWNLYVTSLFASTPVTLFFLYGAGVLEVMYQATIHLESLLLLSWIVLPLVWLSLPFVPKRGGHLVTFILPALSVVAALTVEKASMILASVLRVGIGYREISLFLGFFFIGLLVFHCMTAHPYYHNYYNFVARSLDKENTIVLFGWWGEGLGEAMAYVDENAPSNTTIWVYGPKATAFYHSERVNLEGSLKGERLLYEWGKVGADVQVDEGFRLWRKGDLRFYFPYYHPSEHNNFAPAKLRAENVSHIVVYKWATYPPKVTAIDPGNRHTISTLKNNHVPAFTVKVKDMEVCWVYRVDDLEPKHEGQEYGRSC